MQIGKFIQYSDTDALRNSLTYNNSCKYSAKVVQSSCITPSKTVGGISFGGSNVLGLDVVKLTMYFKRYSNTDTQGRFIFQNIFPKASTDTTKNNGWLINASTGVNTITIGTLQCTFTESWWSDLGWHYLELSYEGNYESPTSITVKIDGVEKSLTAISTVANLTNNYWTKIYYNDSSFCNICMYDSNNELVHHYPCSEGIGEILYDTVGNVHATLGTASNLYTLWNKTQDFYHYNLTNGYVSIDGDDIDRFSKTLKIPLKDASSVLVAKDSYQSGINNYTVMAEGAGWNNYTSSTVTLVSDSTNGNYIKVQVTDGFISTTKTLNNCTLMTEFNGSLPATFTSPNLPASYNNFINVNPQIPVQYNFKCKVRCNTYTYDGTDQGTLSFRFTMLHGGVNSFIANMTSLTDGEWHEIDLTSIINSNGVYTSASTDRTFCYLQIRSVTPNGYINIDLDIKDIELYRISNCTYHPPILNGHNGAETKFDFSQGISDASEVRNDLLYAYRPGLITTADESLGANGSMRSNGWSGAMATITSAGNITNGLWTIYYNKTGNANNGYIDNYTLTDDELAMMGLSSKGVAAQAIQFTSIGSILSNSTQNVTLYYRVNLSTLFGKLVFPNVLGWSYKVHFTGWVKKLVEYGANLQLATAYQNVLQPGGQVLIPESEFTDNEFHYIDKTLSFYYPNNQNSATSTASHLIGLGAYPSGYTSFTNPDTGAAYTATEANHRPTLALAKVKITFEPQEVYFKDGKGFKLMNYNNMALSRYQTTRQNNQTTFNL